MPRLWVLLNGSKRNLPQVRKLRVNDRVQLMTHTQDQIVEAMARAIYEAVNGAGCRPWASLERWHKDSYRAQAKAALTVAEPMIRGGGNER